MPRPACSVCQPGSGSVLHACITVRVSQEADLSMIERATKWSWCEASDWSHLKQEAKLSNSQNSAPMVTAIQTTCLADGIIVDTPLGENKGVVHRREDDDVGPRRLELVQAGDKAGQVCL